MSEHDHRIDRPLCNDFQAARHLEWLVTNGRGGFAMGTISQMLTRRYHGLLVAAIDPPVERYVLLAKLDATVRIGGAAYELSTNEYAGGFRTQGVELLESFSLRPYPTWRWRVGDALLEQTLCMAEGEDTTFVRYRLLEGAGPVTLEAWPVCTSRHFHVLAHRTELKDPCVEVRGDRLAFAWPDKRPAWRLSHNGAFDFKSAWHYNFFLSTEHERGYDHTQDFFVPGPITAALEPGESTGLIIAASTQDRSWKDWKGAFSRTDQSDRVSLSGTSDDPLIEPLVRASSDFLVTRDVELKTVIAGYPWFGDWGRDTFISLPGLCLVQDRLEDARRIILAFAGYVSEGMIPNRFPDFCESPAYDTIDASLWYVHAIDRYLAYTGDWAFVADRMFPVVRDILQCHERGTRHNIRLCDDGLLAGGEDGFALTWMDAKLPDRAITPRIGKPVEINALWYNALRIAQVFAERLGQANLADHWRGLADRTGAAFNRRFWNEPAGCLLDVVDVNDRAGTSDPAVRPNQLFAVSLTHPVLDPTRWQSVVSICERELWTPLGLRTLSPRDPAYRGRYFGDLVHRDEAYHQGTVWPWLLGPFVTAYVKGHEQPLPHPARRFLEGLLPHFQEDGIGSVCEVADGDPPHTPGGCPWQAWSVAEPLRAMCEDVYRTHPRAPGTQSATATA